MADNNNGSNSTAGAGAAMGDPRAQTFTLYGPDGSQYAVSAAFMTDLYRRYVATDVNYGSQIGATFLMLLVLLTMTPRPRFRRLPTLLNLAALAVNLARCLLLSLYFTSSWTDFYTSATGDVRYVRRADYHVSVAATALGLPVAVLVEAALAVQAWSMIRLWSRPRRLAAVAVSALLVLAAVGFRFASVVLQSEGIDSGKDLTHLVWIKKYDLVFGMASITWFCFLFVVRLVAHMWVHRTMLPSVRGLSAMEVLVMTNGILMLVPVLFAGLEFGSWTQFESGSLTFTSVVIVLPLGNLVALRIANPAAFSVPSSQPHAPSPSSPAASHAASSSSKAPFLHHNTWQSVSRGGAAGASRTGPAAAGGVSARVTSSGKRDRDAEHFEAELARIDSGDLERGVRVHHQIDHHEERKSENSF